MKNLISVQQLQDKDLLDRLFKRADFFATNPPASYPKSLENKIIASLFFEPSTRTRLSFEAAVQRLGGQIITVENAEHSSVKKGESLEDTIRTVEAYSDGIVMRHPEIGAAKRAAAVSNVPIINAGDGGGDHPSQALLDVYSIHKFAGKVDGLKIALVGDLKHSRTHHALIQLLSIFNVELFLVSPPQTPLPGEIRDYLKKMKISFTESGTWKDIISTIDVIYMNRVQKERFASETEYDAVKDTVRLTLKDVEKLRKSAIILDPLPRVNEIDMAVDGDPRAMYFQQVKNGLFTRMALLEFLFSSQ